MAIERPHHPQKLANTNWGPAETRLQIQPQLAKAESPTHGWRALLNGIFSLKVVIAARYG